MRTGPRLVNIRECEITHSDKTYKSPGAPGASVGGPVYEAGILFDTTTGTLQECRDMQIWMNWHLLHHNSLRHLHFMGERAVQVYQAGTRMLTKRVKRKECSLALHNLFHTDSISDEERIKNSIKLKRAYVEKYTATETDEWVEKTAGLSAKEVKKCLEQSGNKHLRKHTLTLDSVETGYAVYGEWFADKEKAQQRAQELREKYDGLAAAAKAEKEEAAARAMAEAKAKAEAEERARVEAAEAEANATRIRREREQQQQKEAQAAEKALREAEAAKKRQEQEDAEAARQAERAAKKEAEEKALAAKKARRVAFLSQEHIDKTGKSKNVLSRYLDLYEETVVMIPDFPDRVSPEMFMERQIAEDAAKREKQAARKRKADEQERAWLSRRV